MSNDKIDNSNGSIWTKRSHQTKSWAVQNKALLHKNVDKLEKHAKPCILTGEIIPSSRRQHDCINAKWLTLDHLIEQLVDIFTLNKRKVSLNAYVHNLEPACDARVIVTFGHDARVIRWGEAGEVCQTTHVKQNDITISTCSSRSTSQNFAVYTGKSEFPKIFLFAVCRLLKNHHRSSSRNPHPGRCFSFAGQKSQGNSWHDKLALKIGAWGCRLMWKTNKHAKCYWKHGHKR